jgi:hypothetical protein
MTHPQQRAAQGLRSFADHLHDMSAKHEDSGIGPKLIRQVAGRTHTLASWWHGRQPGDFLNEARSFLQRRPDVVALTTALAGVLVARRTPPGVLPAATALAGVVVGRLTRGAVADSQTDSADDHEPVQERRPVQAMNPALSPPGYRDSAAASPISPQQSYPTPPPVHTRQPAEGPPDYPPPWYGPDTGQS